MRLLLMLLTLSVATVAEAQSTQRVLAPFDSMLFESASGRWLTELWVHNGGATAFTLPYALCADCRQVPPGETIRANVVPDATAPYPGVWLEIPPEAQISLRVRDANQGVDQIGTEIPVVREADLKRSIVTLINVPLPPRVRPALRIYLAEDWPAEFVVRLYGDDNGRLLAEQVYSYVTYASSPAPPLPFHIAPMIDASSIFRGWIADRVRVTIEPMSGEAFWPLLTITNSRNNQVTVVSPF